MEHSSMWKACASKRAFRIGVLCAILTHVAKVMAKRLRHTQNDPNEEHVTINSRLCADLPTHGPTHMDAIQEIEMSSDGISKEGMKESADRHFKQLHYMFWIMQEPRTAEEKVSQAFIEFYGKIWLLKSYWFLNQLVFSKIMKKYDKVSWQNVLKAYLQMVDKAYSAVLMRKGPKALRTQAKKERHRITFLYGFFSGCSIALIVTIIVNIHARNILKSQGRGKYMVNPVWLHCLAHAHVCWKHIIFEAFIFGFKQGTELGYREVLLLSSDLSLLALAGVISHLDMEIDPRTKSFRTLTELIPLLLIASPI
ncbi:EXS family protein isoform 2 [Hibiscus syriacus]|uniref:EXS family protein isoform 2 n=1 Tax=Hibiscus syriacus TaxID=106335 RepID=A0A6A2ZQY9_HIBSY|nr:EXS family protein isoform 2 [Hibiscus syriacus]